MLTATATRAAILATAMTLPAFVQSFSWDITPEGTGPSGWPMTMFEIAFFVGVTSMLLAHVVRHRERQRGSKAGQKLANRAVRWALPGACISGLMLLTMGFSGL